MNSVWQSSLEEIRETTASNKPLATSGAISLISAVYACSLLQMVLKISFEKCKSRTGKTRISELLPQVENASRELSRLADNDIEVFHKFLDSFLLPVETIQQQKLKQEQVAVMRLEAIRIPSTAAELITKLYSIIFESMQFCSKNVLPDLAVTANIFYGAIASLLWSVRVNALKLKAVQRSNVNASARLLKTDARAATKQVDKQVSKLLGIS